MCTNFHILQKKSQIEKAGQPAISKYAYYCISPEAHTTLLRHLHRKSYQVRNLAMIKIY